ncbi:Transcription termination factor [Gracilaria domingensis]|nr:Transcription termination factor [Gracilaria domingensis]
MNLNRRPADGREDIVATLLGTGRNSVVFVPEYISGVLTMPLAFCSFFLGNFFSKSLNPNPNIRTTKCAIPYFTPAEACARSIGSSKHHNRVADIEAKLGSLGARYPAEQVRAALSLQETHVHDTWPLLLSVLSDHGFTNMTLSRIVSKLGVISLLNVSPASASNLFHLFDKYLRLSSQEQKRILSNVPHVLERDIHLITATLQGLHDLGMQLKDVRRVVMRFPNILLLHRSSVLRLAQFLQSSPMFFPEYKVRSFLCRHPWTFSHDIDTLIAPSIDWLTEYVLLKAQKPDIAQLIVSAPGILGMKRASLHSVMRLLEIEVRLKEKDRRSVINRHPRLLVCSPEKQLRPVLNFLLLNLRLRYNERRKIVRAFPHILTLDMDQKLMPVVDFFVHRGASNVSRLVKLFPPILCNDLQTNTVPKVDYFMRELGLPMDEILKFPACFSYDLASRIIPRTQFVQRMGCSVLDFGLNRSISSSDEEFCRFLHVQLHSYVSFSKACARAVEDKIHIEKVDIGKEGRNVTIDINEVGQKSYTTGKSITPTAETMENLQGAD